MLGGFIFALPGIFIWHIVSAYFGCILSHSTTKHKEQMKHTHQTERWFCFIPDLFVFIRDFHQHILELHMLIYHQVYIPPSSMLRSVAISFLRSWLRTESVEIRIKMMVRSKRQQIINKREKKSEKSTTTTTTMRSAYDALCEQTHEFWWTHVQYIGGFAGWTATQQERNNMTCCEVWSTRENTVSILWITNDVSIERTQVMWHETQTILYEYEEKRTT